MNSEKVLMVLAGRPPRADLLNWRLEEADLSIAVDGGWECFRAAELVPNAWIGDGDSCDEFQSLSSDYENMLVIPSIDQDSTDFEKAAIWVNQNTNCSDLVVLGGVGERSDHFLSNLIIAANFNSRWTVTFDDTDEWIRRVTPETPLSLKGRNGSTLSILPIEECKLSTNGLKWELSDEKLSIRDSKVSQSNECISDNIEVKCQSGCAFVFLVK